jgi:hypothetical protein
MMVMTSVVASVPGNYRVLRSTTLPLNRSYWASFSVSCSGDAIGRSAGHSVIPTMNPDLVSFTEDHGHTVTLAEFDEQIPVHCTLLRGLEQGG